MVKTPSPLARIWALTTLLAAVEDRDARGHAVGGDGPDGGREHQALPIRAARARDAVGIHLG